MDKLIEMLQGFFQMLIDFYNTYIAKKDDDAADDTTAEV